MAAKHRAPEHPTPLTFQILLALADSARHGYGIIKEIQEREGNAAAPSTGALYLALQRMESDGLIQDAPTPDGEDVDPRRRYYRISTRGRRVAEEESSRLAALVASARGKGLLSTEAAAGGDA